MIRRHTVNLPCGGQWFSFKLCRRQIDMGPAVPIEYSWMALPALRQSQGSLNVRNCIDLWWAETLQQTFTNPEDGLAADVNLCLAELYPLVISAKARQAVFVDAFLKPTQSRKQGQGGDQDDDGELDDRQFVLPNQDWTRLRTMCRQRDIQGIGQEIVDLFVGDQPPPRERELFNEALRRWMTNAVVALRTHGQSGLRAFLKDELVNQIAKIRRKGGNQRVRLFINMLAYETKVAFHLCYANAWSKLTPWLIHQHRLNTASVRFLSLWHHQNSFHNGRDAFWGHVLALHPLAERVMTQAHHRAAVGQWLVAAANDPLGGPIVDRDEYWDMVASILAAGREYVALRNRANTVRVKTAGLIDASDTASQDPTIAELDTIENLFDEYAREQLLDCRQCQNHVALIGHEVTTSVEGTIFRVTYECRACGHQATTDIDIDEVLAQNSGAKTDAA